MTKSQGEALVALLHQLRKDWDTPGIRVAIQRAQTLGSPADVATAACRVAANTAAKTPGLIPEPGAHWQGTAVGQRQAPVMCPDHPDQRLTRCTACQARLNDTDHQAGAALVRAELAKYRRRPPTRHPEPEQHDLTGARARADQEKP